MQNHRRHIQRRGKTDNAKTSRRMENERRSSKRARKTKQDKKRTFQHSSRRVRQTNVAADGREAGRAATGDSRLWRGPSLHSLSVTLNYHDAWLRLGNHSPALNDLLTTAQRSPRAAGTLGLFSARPGKGSRGGGEVLQYQRVKSRKTARPWGNHGEEKTKASLLDSVSALTRAPALYPSAGSVRTGFAPRQHCRPLSAAVLVVHLQKRGDIPRMRRLRKIYGARGSRGLPPVGTSSAPFGR